MADFNINRVEDETHAEYNPYVAGELAEFLKADGVTKITREFNGKGWKELDVVIPEVIPTVLIDGVPGTVNFGLDPITGVLTITTT